MLRFCSFIRLNVVFSSINHNYQLACELATVPGVPTSFERYEVILLLYLHVLEASQVGVQHEHCSPTLKLTSKVNRNTLLLLEHPEHCAACWVHTYKNKYTKNTPKERWIQFYPSLRINQKQIVFTPLLLRVGKITQDLFLCVGH